MSELVAIYDTTLRDGMQREGLSLSVGEQLAVAVRLAEYGIDYIEAGFPASNPKYGELFRLLEDEDLGATRLAAFGMTRRRGAAASEDPALRGLAECAAPVATIVGKTWDLHIEKVTRVTREENLRMIEESVAFLVGQGKEVVYDAEHFFDAYAAHPAYAIDCLRAAQAGGAAWITPCDTNGATLPARCAAVIRDVRAALPGAALGIHTHNDAECAVANSLAAVDEGARMVQGTINGYGERCGNANLVSIIPSLSLKMGYRTVPPDRLAELTALSRLRRRDGQPAARRLGALRRPQRLRAQGRHAPAGRERRRPRVRAHRPGDGRQRAPRAGLRAVGARHHPRQGARARRRPRARTRGGCPAILGRLKELEHRGYHFEVADGSFELLLERETGVYEPLFTLESFRVITEKRADGRVETEATVKLFHRGERLVATAEGNGPVNALDAALRIALEPRVPELAAISLVNFKVRILDETKGTGAVTRVLIDSGDGRETWGAIGVSENIIEASWEALLDSLEYGVRRSARAPAPTAPAG